MPANAGITGAGSRRTLTVAQKAARRRQAAARRRQAALGGGGGDTPAVMGVFNAQTLGAHVHGEIVGALRTYATACQLTPAQAWRQINEFGTLT